MKTYSSFRNPTDPITQNLQEQRPNQFFSLGC